MRVLGDEHIQKTIPERLALDGDGHRNAPRSSGLARVGGYVSIASGVTFWVEVTDVL